MIKKIFTQKNEIIPTAILYTFIINLKVSVFFPSAFRKFVDPRLRFMVT